MPASKKRPQIDPKLLRLAESLAAPIDFDQLIADGILRKAGAWYQVLDAARLPDHVRHKVKGVKSGNRVQFRKPPKRVRKFLRSLGPAEDGSSLGSTKRDRTRPKA